AARRRSTGGCIPMVRRSWRVTRRPRDGFFGRIERSRARDGVSGTASSMDGCRTNTTWHRLATEPEELSGRSDPVNTYRKSWLGILVVSLVATLAFVTIPRYPYLLDDALSEKAVLSYAHQHGLQFGKDIIFTYGPLGFLVSRYFFSHAAGARMAT